MNKPVHPAPRPRLSREWMKGAPGKVPFCEWPWNDLFVNLSNETRICCSFFTKLEPFEWPSARDFHKETGMWNHPFMQHMRSKMGTADEVPYCTACLTLDKRDPANRAAVAEAKKESLKVYRRLQTRQPVRGTIDAITIPLSEWQMEIPGGSRTRVIRPFRLDKHHYRTVVQRFRFCDRKKVLLAAPNRDWLAPFLAEMNDEVVIADLDARTSRNAPLVCRALGMDNVSAREGTEAGPLPFEDASFDAIWIHGGILAAARDVALLPELRRILMPKGTLHVHEFPCIGRLIERFVAGDLSKAGFITHLAPGPRLEGPDAYMFRQSLQTALVKAGLSLDKAVVPGLARYKSERKARPFAELGAREMMERLRAPQVLDGLRNDPEALAGMEKFVSFNALR